MLATKIKQWEKDLIAQGVQQERKLSRKRSITLLSQLLTLKYGELPELVKQRIQSASPEELDEWSESVLSSESLDAIFPRLT